MSVDIATVASFVIESAIRLERIPVLGESLRGEHYYLAPGGKGTNQAVAAARQGKEVGIVGKVGDDLYGRDGRRAVRARRPEHGMVSHVWPTRSRRPSAWST